MNYDELKQYLLDEFSLNNFEGLYNENRTNTGVILAENNYNLNLTIAFPGYKTKFRNNRFTYDYRVDLNRIAISHANIVTDIYNKSVQAPELRTDIYNFLIDLAQNGLNINLNNYERLLNYEFNPPPNELLTLIKDAHGNKFYNRNANSWNYSFQELSTIIPYIVLQEDINYPMPRFEGRRMSFYRYIEAIFCLEDNEYSIINVINRTLSHIRPALWNEYIEMYQPIINL